MTAVFEKCGREEMREGNWIGQKCGGSIWKIPMLIQINEIKEYRRKIQVRNIILGELHTCTSTFGVFEAISAQKDQATGHTRRLGKDN